MSERLYESGEQSQVGDIVSLVSERDAESRGLEFGKRYRVIGFNGLGNIVVVPMNAGGGNQGHGSLRFRLVERENQGEARQTIATLEQQVAGLREERDRLASSLESTRGYRKAAELERVEAEARATAAEAERDEAVKRLRGGLLGVEELARMRDTLERIGTEYPSVSGPITCPPAPHACPKCEIQFLLEADLRPVSDQVKPGETDVATPGNDA